MKALFAWLFGVALAAVFSPPVTVPIKVTQTIQSVTISSTTFLAGQPNANIGTVSVAMHSGPAFAGTIAISGADAGTNFQISGPTVKQNSSGTAVGSYSHLTITATPTDTHIPPVSISPVFQAEQNIASVTLTNSSFPANVPSGVIGTAACTMNPAVPACAATFSLAPANGGSGSFQIAGSSLEQAATNGTPPGTYSDVSLVATQAGTLNGSLSTSLTLIGSGTVQPVIAVSPAAPAISDATAKGATVANVTVSMSDNSTFNGTLGFAAPNNDDNGVFSLSANGTNAWLLLVNPNGSGIASVPPGTTVTDNITLSATTANVPESVFDNSNQPWPLTNLVLATAYDNGGQGVAYNAVRRTDTACVVDASAYRPDYINFKPFSWSTVPSMQYALCGSNAGPGDWHNYTMAVSAAGQPVKITLYTVNADAGAVWTLSLDPTPANPNGTTLTTVTLPGSGNFTTVLSTSTGNLNIADGTHILRFTATSGATTGGYVGDFVAWQGSVVSVGAGVACEQGPNVSAVPAPAAAAGFNHCILNADFRTNTTDANGINWSQPSTYVAECGAPDNAQHALWHMIFNWPGSNYSHMPCNRFILLQDAGVQVADFNWYPSDYNSHLALINVFNWPGSQLSGAGGPYNLGTGQLQYYEILFRTTPQTWVTSFSAHTQPVDFWKDQCNGCGNPVNFAEIDWWELNANGYFQTGTDAQPVQWGGSGGAYYQDATIYHTSGYLVTSDGTNASVCAYLDGGVATRTTAAPCPVGDFTGHDVLNGEFAQWVGGDDCFSDATHPQGCEPYPAEVYIQYIRIFSCDGFWTSGTACQGPVIQDGALDNGHRFAWLGKAFNWLFSTAKADDKPAPSLDKFSLPSHGLWMCPDGSKRTGAHGGIVCIPSELLGKDWWKECVAGRTDCVHSERAFLGWDEKYLAKRGPGYCYTQQPYTCSPDGKLP
jgi:hypothetical protein